MTNIWSTTHDQPSYTGRGRVREGGREGGRERQREGGRERHTHYAETARKHGRFLKWQHPCRRAGQCAPVFSSVCLSECACYMNIPRWPLPRPQAPPNAARSLTPGPPAYRSPCPWDPPLYHLPEMLRRYRPQHATAARDLVQARLRGYNRTAPVHVYMMNRFFLQRAQASHSRGIGNAQEPHTPSELRMLVRANKLDTPSICCRATSFLPRSIAEQHYGCTAPPPRTQLYYRSCTPHPPRPPPLPQTPVRDYRALTRRKSAEQTMNV